MAALAINLLALLIVLGLCWGAMMWLAGKSHGHGVGRNTEYEFESVEYRDDMKLTRRGRVDLSGADNGPADKQPTTVGPPPAPCAVCEGVGAHHGAGKLAPCPQCYGTGVLP